MANSILLSEQRQILRSGQRQSFAGYFVPLSEAVTGLSPIDQNHAHPSVPAEPLTERQRKAAARLRSIEGSVQRRYLFC
jgi:hypothetical protein